MQRDTAAAARVGAARLALRSKSDQRLLHAQIVTLINNEAGTSSGLVAALAVAGLQPVSLTVEPAPLAPAW